MANDVLTLATQPASRGRRHRLLTWRRIHLRDQTMLCLAEHHGLRALVTET